jgi:hypothetical protein
MTDCRALFTNVVLFALVPMKQSIFLGSPIVCLPPGLPRPASKLRRNSYVIPAVRLS